MMYNSDAEIFFFGRFADETYIGATGKSTPVTGWLVYSGGGGLMTITVSRTAYSSYLPCVASEIKSARPQGQFFSCPSGCCLYLQCQQPQSFLPRCGDVARSGVHQCRQESLTFQNCASFYAYLALP